MKHNSFTLVTLTAAAVLIGGCTKQPDAPRSGANAEQPKPRAQTRDESNPVDAAATVAPALSVYEDIRAKLAADDIAGAAERADALAKAATTAAADAPEALRSRLADTAKAAEALAGTPTDDADAVRKAFGEVSRPLVVLIGASPSLQESAHVFECPMAQGYQKWVQQGPTIENPYMGQRMLACGSKTTWDG